MDETSFIKLLKQSTVDHVLDVLENMHENDRIKCSKRAMTLYRQVYRFTGGGSGIAKDPNVLDFDAPVAGVLGCASLEDILALKHIPVPLNAPATKIFGRLALPWLQDAVETLLQPNDVLAMESLWVEGICNVPQSEALMLGYLDEFQSGKLSMSVLLDDVVWRFFKTPGKRSTLNLPGHDKRILDRRALGYDDQNRGDPWAERLLHYVQRSALERDRIITATIAAIGVERSGAEVTWFEKFFASLAPTKAEREKCEEMFKALAERPKSPSATFGVRQLKQLAIC